MFKAIFYSLFLLQPLFGASESFPPNDEKAIRDVLENHYSAWNQRDIKKMAGLYASDGDLRTSWSQKGKNREGVEATYLSELSKMKNAHIDHTIQSIRMIKPDIAFADVESTITGMQTEAKSTYPPFHHHVVFVLVKREGKWQILIGRPF